MRRKSSSREASGSSPDEIRRRDFVNGVLASVGGAAVGRFLPGCGAEAAAVAPPQGVCDGVIGADPRVLRGGNVPSAFNVGHYLRDGRLSFALPDFERQAFNPSSNVPARGLPAYCDGMPAKSGSP